MLIFLCCLFCSLSSSRVSVEGLDFLWELLGSRNYNEHEDVD